MSFPMALGFTLRWEGGCVDDFSDPGGRTAYGITQHSFDGWLGEHQDVFTASGDQVASFYRAYWIRMGGQGFDQIDERLGLLMFDASVQHGNKLAIQFLQRALGELDDDGRFGSQTLNRLHEVYLSDSHILLDDLVRERQDHYQERGLKPQLTQYLDGWLRRIGDCQAIADCQVAALVNVVKHANGGVTLPIAIKDIP